MSTKGSHTSAFFLIDAEEYTTISELKEKCLQLESKLTDALKYKRLADSAHKSHLEAKVNELETQLKHHKGLNSVTTETLQPSSSEEQVGSGSCNGVPNTTADKNSLDKLTSEFYNEDQSRQKLLSAFESFIKLHNSFSSSSAAKLADQTGCGVESDLTPNLPLPIQEKPSTLVENNDITNGTSSAVQSSSVDRLMTSVAATSRPKAEKLLRELENIQSEMSFDNAGNIKINGSTLPDVNFYEIFPLLFKPVKNYRSNSGLSLIVDELASLGLGHLIQRSYTAGLTPKGQHYLKNRAALKKNLTSRWYFLGNDQ